ncbi:hypothetical protein JCM10207_004433 [Rhodosporidiobolus poonsookiae]
MASIVSRMMGKQAASAISITPQDPTAAFYGSPSPPASPPTSQSAARSRSRSPSPTPAARTTRPRARFPSPAPTMERDCSSASYRRTPSPSPAPRAVSPVMARSPSPAAESARSPSPDVEEVLTPAQKRAQTRAVNLAKKTATAKKQPKRAATSDEEDDEERKPAGRRSTRSSGKADHFVPLEGAPKGSKSRRAAPPPPRKRFRESSAEESSEDEEEEVVVVRPTKRAAPKPAAKKTKRAASQLPSPARSTASPAPSRTRDAESSDDEVASPIAKPPPRKRATRTVDLDLAPPSPALTPKKRALPVSKVSPHTPKVPSPLKKAARRAVAAFSDSEREEEPEQLEGADELDEDELTLLPSSSTPRKTPPKVSSTSTPVTTPSSSRTSSITPSRSSSRIQRLPPSLVDIAKAPAALRSRLVGFHMEDEGYGVQNELEQDHSSEEEPEEEDEEAVAAKRAAKGKGRAVEEDEVQQDDVEMRDVDFEVDLQLPTPPAIFPTSTSSAFTAPSASPTSYLTSPLRLHLTSTLALLSGQRLPRPALAPNAQTTLPPRETPLLQFPYLEGGYDEWERPLRAALGEVVEKGMGNAVMLLGPRGVGKTMIIDRTLSILSYLFGPSAFATVRLSGLVHTTDRLALRSIAMQLQQQGFGGGEFELDEGDYSSNSATMTTLLRLLEPSSSTAPSAGSSSTSAEKSKPLVLIVDEFDLFAQHPRQSFLYCLLDIVQGNRRRGGVAVVGVSSRVDCLSLLEKRVRSRCQSHVLQIMPSSSLTSFTSLGKRLLKADERAWELERGVEGKDWAARWNEEVERWCGEKKVREYMERVWMMSGGLPTELRSSLAHMLYRLDYRCRLQGVQEDEVPQLEFGLLKPQTRGEDRDRDEVLKHLTTVELAVLIACKHLSSSTTDRQTGFNFEMVYDSYLQHARRASATGGALGVGVKAYSKPALREAFDTLRTHELLLPRSSSSSSASTATAGLGGPVTVPSLAYRAPTARDPFRLFRLVPWAKDVDREVEARGNACPLGLRRWCKNWLD